MKTTLKMSMLGICLLSTPAFANSEGIKSVPEFTGGLKVSKINQCEKTYTKACPVYTSKSGMAATMEQWTCTEKKMAEDKSCAQASVIRKLTGAPATAFKQYGPVTVFYYTTIADGVDVFYMVDTKGQLIPLNTAVDLSKNQDYVTLKKKYPKIALTGFLYWTKINENLFPKSHILPDKNQQLVFRQELRSPDCVACAKVGFANVAYEFNPEGVYIDSKVLKITATK